MNEDKPFWLVWNQSAGYPPRFCHETRISAEKEAERLARLNPGQEYVVLEAVSKVQCRDPVQWTQLGW